MLVGYNTNVPFKGNTYHVQTEDTGLENLVILSLLYFKGAILASRKTSYAHVKGDNIKEQVRELMKEQHKALIKELLSGKLTGETAVPESIVDIREEEKVKTRKTLDDILIDYILKQTENK